VQALFNDVFGKRCRRSVSPVEAVAVGAAIQAAQLLLGSKSEVLLVDVIPLSLSLETSGGRCVRMVERNTSIPTEKKQIFTTTRDNQPGVSLRIYQGESPCADKNQLLGQLDVDDLAPAPRGNPAIEVRFDLDQNGFLQVSAEDCQSGTEKTLRVARCRPKRPGPAPRVSPQGLRRGANDPERQTLPEVMAQADRWIEAARERLALCADRLGPADLGPIRTLITDLQLATGGDNVETIHRAIEALERALEGLARFVEADVRIESERRGVWR
jgi:molecular chaperone DnaK